MRPPHFLIRSRYFQFSNVSEFIRALGDTVSLDEIAEIKRLDGLGLAPVSSIKALSVMLGINSGLLWSIQNKPHKFYRVFNIPKGNGVRVINAPRVVLKVIQKWLSVQFECVYQAPPHVFGFVSNKSHINAASVHCHARWIFSVDIRDFFQTTPVDLVRYALTRLGYDQVGANLIAQICCVRGFLAQGSPASPVLSNICMSSLDLKLIEIADELGCKLTRYADDIVFSSGAEPPEDIESKVRKVFEGSSWQIAQEKTHFAILPNRLKVHGLLVHGEAPRLTKGYRKKIRAYRHLLAKGKVKPADISKLQGHIVYSDFVNKN